MHLQSKSPATTLVQMDTAPIIIFTILIFKVRTPARKGRIDVRAKCSQNLALPMLASNIQCLLVQNIPNKVRRGNLRSMDVPKTASLIVIISHWGKKEMELLMDDKGRTMG